MEPRKICVTMPAFNEEGRIGRYLSELAEQLADWNPSFVVVDDASADGTGRELSQLVENGWPLKVLRNRENLGHGPSTIVGLTHASSESCDAVLAIDGDGQADPLSLRGLLRSLEHQDWVVVEGNRTGRDDPRYRRFVSKLTRLMVFIRSRSKTFDANTPVRLYSKPLLEELLALLPNRPLTPNLHISAILRRAEIRITLVDVAWRNPLDTGLRGLHWGRRQDKLPSKRFIKFCLKASSQWIASRKTDADLEALKTTVSGRKSAS